MTNTPPCPKCNYEYTYFDGQHMVCSDCLHEWDASEASGETIPPGEVITDANGNVLINGDSVIVIKDLPVKGSSKSVKAGTKVKNIKLAEGDHNISCRIEGFGAMGLKSEFVRKA